METQKKVLLTVPNNNWTGARTQWNSFPLTSAVLTSVLKGQYQTRTLDCAFYDLSQEQVINQIREYNPDVVGISCISFENDRDVRKLTSLVRTASPQAHIVVGGIYPTLLPERIMRNQDIDFAVMGEGEYRLPKLLGRISRGEPMDNFNGLAYRNAGEVVIQPVTEYIQDLDVLPLPCYDDVNFEDYANAKTKKNSTMLPRRFPYAQICATRGCPFDCVFCSTKLVNGPKIRERSAESILKEVDWLVDKYKVKEIIFVDDNLYIDKKRIKKTLEGLIERNHDLEWKCTDGQIIALDDEMLELMKRSGCYELCVSIEGGNEETLKLMNKPRGTVSKARGVIEKAKQLGMYTISSFIVGLPGETWEQVRQTAKFAEELDLDFCTFNIANPLPRTQLYNICTKQGLLQPDFNFDNFRGYGFPNITTKEFTPSELLMFRVMEWDRINFKTPEKIRKIAERNGMTIEEIEEWRVSTRRGVDVQLKRLETEK
jgi:radical SAM superfamily enzyme YgiQ (UPF0313 family)